MEEQGTYLVSWWVYLFSLIPTCSIVFSEWRFLPSITRRVNWFLFSLLNSIRIRAEDKQLVVLEKIPNRWENVKLLFLLSVVGSISCSAGMRMRVSFVMRMMARTWSPAPGRGRLQPILSALPKAVVLPVRRGAKPYRQKNSWHD